jgi:hypothetical protein
MLKALETLASVNVEVLGGKLISIRIDGTSVSTIQELVRLIR